MLRADYHVHSDFSDGQPNYKQILDRAKELKLDVIAITDHFDKYDGNKRTSSITDDELLNFFKDIKAYGEEIGQKVLCGIETCTDFKGNLRISDRVINNCEIIITSPHYVEYERELVPGNYFDEVYWEKYKEKVINMAGGEGDILGHAEAYLPYGRLLMPNTTTFEERKKLAKDIACRFFDDNYIDELIKALKKSGKAFELHCITQTPREQVIKKLAENSVTMSLGSDAHDLSAVGKIAWGEEMFLKYGCNSLQFNKNI